MTDIEQELAEALHTADSESYPGLCWYDYDCGWGGQAECQGPDEHRKQAAAILATPSMQALAALAWREAERHHQSLDADTDDWAWNDAMVMTIDALNKTRDAIDAYREATRDE